MSVMESVMERYRNPRHKGFQTLDHYEASACGNSPLCGDSIEMCLVIDESADGEKVVRAAAFDGYACSLCQATADLLSERIQGMPLSVLRNLTSDDLVRMWGNIRVGRSRQACLELPLVVAKRACQDICQNHL